VVDWWKSDISSDMSENMLIPLNSVALIYNAHKQFRLQSIVDFAVNLITIVR